MNIIRMAEELALRAAGTFRTRSEKLECQKRLLKLLNDLRQIDTLFIETKLVIDQDNNLVFKEKEYVCGDRERVITPKLVGSFEEVFTKIDQAVRGRAHPTDVPKPNTEGAMLLRNILVQCRDLWNDGGFAYHRMQAVKSIVQTVVSITPHVGMDSQHTEIQDIWHQAICMENFILHHEHLRNPDARD